jgi:2-keto-4-pentenoate hydratase/2-oxohepta-3-ene-1,7-dioic acid hydratase in catechol pathway
VKIARFTGGGSERPRLGVLVGGRIHPLADAAGEVEGGWAPHELTLEAMIRSGELRALADRARVAEARGPGGGLAEDEVRFLPPVTPTKILAIGRNYADHALEGGQAPPSAPLVFTKLPSALSAHQAPIVLPAISDAVDFEAELAVVIGRRAKRVREAEALDHVFGYTLVNDVTARDLQFGDGQWVRGKGLDTFAPIGPYVTTADEIEDPHALAIEGRLNGEVMQSSNTSRMIFKIPYLISYISQAITLEPGDVIATGTPEGVGYFREPKVLLKAGDVFEVTVERLGTLRNVVVGPDALD